MRRLGYWVVDRVVEHFEQGADGPAINASPADESAGRARRPRSRGTRGSDRGDADARRRRAVEHAARRSSPLFRARAGPSSYAGVLGDWLGTGFNVIAASWAGSSGPVDGGARRARLAAPAARAARGTEGILMSGGSLSNMTALAAARAQLGSGVAYLSDQTHASIPRALTALGFAAEDVRVLTSDERLRLTGRLSATPSAPTAARGLNPRFIVATAGTTNTGAVDELEGLAELAAAEGHVASRGRRLRRAGRAVPGRTGGAARTRASGLARARPPQMAVRSLRRRMPVRAPSGGAGSRVQHAPRVPRRRPARHSRGQLRRPQPRADPPLAGAEAVADAQGVRRRAVRDAIERCIASGRTRAAADRVRPRAGRW